MARLDDIMPESKEVKKQPIKPGTNENKANPAGRKRRAWLENDEENEKPIDNKETSQAIDVLNDLSSSQKENINTNFKGRREVNLNNEVHESAKPKKHPQAASNTPITRKIEQGEDEEPEKEDKIRKIDPFLIKRWAEKDRPENELGDIKGLAKTFESVGQLSPSILRPIKDSQYKYELIVGECRWEAAKLAKLPLKAIVREMNDNIASLIQAIENDKRNDLSEYARGMSLAVKIEKGLLSQKDVINILGISKQQVSRLLSFKKIPAPLYEAIEDFRMVSARTAEELCRLSNKGKAYIEALTELAPKIRTGKYGHNSINRDMKKKLEDQSDKEKLNTKVFGSDGRHLFTWRLDNNSIPSIHFPRDIMKLLKEEKLNFDELTGEVKQWLTNKLSDLN